MLFDLVIKNLPILGNMESDLNQATNFLSCRAGASQRFGLKVENRNSIMCCTRVFGARIRIS